jgi:hypothetical protein
MVLNKEELQIVLFKIIPDTDLCVKIINLKDKIEKEDTLEYHIERYDTIYNKYKSSFQYDSLGSKTFYSYIIDETQYFSNKDRYLDFYNETGISYQVKSLLLDILNSPTTDKNLIHNDGFSLTDEKIRNYNDKLFSTLAQGIMKKMS